MVFAGAAAAKVERKFFDLFARLLVDHNLAHRHPATVATTGTLVLVVVILGRWVRGMCARLIHVNLLGQVGRVPWSGNSSGAIYVIKSILPQFSTSRLPIEHLPFTIEPRYVTLGWQTGGESIAAS